MRGCAAPPHPGIYQSKIILVKKVMDMMSDCSNHDLHEIFIKLLYLSCRNVTMNSRIEQRSGARSLSFPRK